MTDNALVNQVISDIEAAIIANGQGLITADVMRPILKNSLEALSELIGDLTALNTTQKTSLVTAINSILNYDAEAIKILSGSTDPNITQPPVFKVGDFYKLMEGGLLSAFYQYNGSDWVLVSKNVSTSDIRTIRKTTEQLVFDDDDCTVIYDGTGVRSCVFPEPNENLGRVITVVNRSTAFLTAPNNYRTVSLNATTGFIPEQSVLVVQSDGIQWNKIN